MRVLVVGGTGVLGRALLPAFLTAGYEVSVLSDGRGPFAPPDLVAEHIIADRNNRGQLMSAFSHAKHNRWDILIDLVCYTPEQAQILIEGIHNRCRQCLIVSSSFVYDPDGLLPYAENSAVGSPERLGGYPSNKLAMEKIWLKNRSAATIVRLPHVISPGCFPGAVPLHSRDRNVIQRLKNGWPIWLVDSGNQVLSFIDGRDVATVFLGMIESNCFGGTYNLAHPIPTTGAEYIRTLAGLLSVKADIRSVPLGAFLDSGWGWELSAISRVCDVSKITAQLPHRYFDLRNSLMNCLPLWEAAGMQFQADPLRSLGDVDFADRQIALKVIRELASTRLQEGVDVRMNQLPLPRHMEFQSK
jgi:nucleoside-diphosphate-sugar epimerase